MKNHDADEFNNTTTLILAENDTYELLKVRFDSIKTFTFYLQG